MKSKVHNLLKLANWFCKQAFDWVILIHGSIRGFVYIPSFEFQHELLNFATNLRTLERNLEYFGRSFVKSTVTSWYDNRLWQGAQ